MLYHIAIHDPRPGREQDVLDSMHRFGAAAKSQPGLVEVHTFKDVQSTIMVGFGVWESMEALHAARPALAAATEGDRFDEWEDEPPTVYLLEEV